jgi:uncharacterized membrane protein YfhO
MDLDQIIIAYRGILLFHITMYITSLYSRWKGIPLPNAFQNMMTLYSALVIGLTVVLYLKHTHVPRNNEKKMEG